MNYKDILNSCLTTVETALWMTTLIVFLNPSALSSRLIQVSFQTERGPIYPSNHQLLHLPIVGADFAGRSHPRDQPNSTREATDATA